MVEMLPIGDSLFRKSFGLFVCIGVSTTPGATAFTRIPSFAYSMARLRVIALIPPLVIIGIEAFTPAIIRQRGRDADDAPPRFLRQHLFDRKLGHVDDPVNVGGN